jgi:hypothetical protein
VQWDHPKEGRAALRAESGTLLVRGCEFQENKPQVELGTNCTRVIITDNVTTGPLRVENHSAGDVQITNNVGN